MPRTAEANQRLREAQRLRILNAARQVFARKGLAATMSDVAIAAGISQGLAYRYFPGKEAIFRELVLRSEQAGPAMLKHLLKMPEPAMTRLRLLISHTFEEQGQRLEFYRFAMAGSGGEGAPEELRKLLLKQGQAYQTTLRQLIVEGQAAGQVAAGDPDQLVMVIMACLDGLSNLAVRTPERFKKHYPDVNLILRILEP